MRKSLIQKELNPVQKIMIAMMSMMSMQNMENRRGQGGIGVVAGLIAGVGGLIFTTILIFVLVQTIVNANLITDASLEDNATDRLRGNFTAGVDNVSSKVPTILLIGAVVALFGALALLVFIARKMGFLQGSSNFQ